MKLVIVIIVVLVHFYAVQSASTVTRTAARLVKTMAPGAAVSSTTYPYAIIYNSFTNSYLVAWKGSNVLQSRPTTNTVPGEKSISQVLSTSTLSGFDGRSLQVKSSGVIYAMSKTNSTTTTQFVINATTLSAINTTDISSSFFASGEFSGSGESSSPDAYWWYYSSSSTPSVNLRKYPSFPIITCVNTLPSSECDTNYGGLATRVHYVSGKGLSTFDTVRNVFRTYPYDPYTCATGGPTKEYYIINGTTGTYNLTSFMGFTSDGLAWLWNPTLQQLEGYDFLCTNNNKAPYVQQQSWAPLGVNISIQLNPEICTLGYVPMYITIPSRSFNYYNDSCMSTTALQIFFYDKTKFAKVSATTCSSTYFTVPYLQRVYRGASVFDGDYNVTTYHPDINDNFTSFQMIIQGHAFIGSAVPYITLMPPVTPQDYNNAPIIPNAVDCVVELPGSGGNMVKIQSETVINVSATGCSRFVQRTYNWTHNASNYCSNVNFALDPSIVHTVELGDFTAPALTASDYNTTCGSLPLQNYSVSDLSTYTVTYKDELIYSANMSACRTDKIFKKYKRTITATDICSNTAVVVQYITVLDRTPPTFYYNTSVACTCSSVTNPLTACRCNRPEQIVDDCYIPSDEAGAANHLSFADAPGSCVPGTSSWNRTWIVTDFCGNSASAWYNIQT